MAYSGTVGPKKQSGILWYSRGTDGDGASLFPETENTWEGITYGNDEGGVL